MEVATIGFTQSSAEHFFERLKRAGIERLVDLRLHNTGQLAGFAKSGDLAYFLRAIADIDYEHDPGLAPTQEIFERYRKGGRNWAAYERDFLELMRGRGVPRVVDPAPFGRKTVLLCSEATPARCHRRLVAELLAQAWGATVEHL